MKALILLLISLFSLGFCHAQYYHKKMSNPDSFGIPFTKPDTLTSLVAFNNNDQQKFLSFSEMDELYMSLSSDTMYYEEQRIEEGENIFLNFRFRQTGVWYRCTFWLHYTKTNQHAFRQRVFLDFNTNDVDDNNDLLVFQAHYVAFDILQSFPTSVTRKLPTGRMDQLYYLEDIIKETCVDRIHPFSPADDPEFGYVTGHTAGIYGDVSIYELDWLEQKIKNRNHELYLGDSQSDSNSVNFLFYPIGDIQAFYPTGLPRLQYSQFYRLKKPYSTKIKGDKVYGVSELDFLEARSYFIGLNGWQLSYNTDGTPSSHGFFLHGEEHGPHSTYYYNENDEVSIRILMYYYGYVSNEWYYRKSKFYQSAFDLQNYKWNDVYAIKLDLGSYQPDTIDNLKEAKKAYRKYTKQCRKWKIVSTEKKK